MPKGYDGPMYAVCNSDESEPGTCKDRDILRFNPHALVEGMAIGGYAMGATVGYNYIRGEFMDEPYRRFEEAVAAAYRNGLLGRDILGSGVDFDLYGTPRCGRLHLWRGNRAHRIAGGQEGAAPVQAAVPGPSTGSTAGRPPSTTPRRSRRWPSIMRNGADWFMELGRPNNGGTKCFSVSGHVARPGNFEVPLGTPSANSWSWREGCATGGSSRR